MLHLILKGYLRGIKEPCSDLLNPPILSNSDSEPLEIEGREAI